MIGIKRFRVPNVKCDTWTDDDIRLFINSKEAKSSHYYEMYCCSPLLGPRPGEVCGLSEDDFDLKHHIFTYNRGLDKYGNLTDLKNAQSHRPTYVPDVLYNLIKKKLIWKKEMKLMYTDKFRNNFLFNTEIGTPVTPNHYSRMFKRTLKRYNANHDQKLTDITLYECRHTFATTNLERGESDKLLSEIMGNSVKTFLQKYAHVRGKKEENTLEKYSNIIFK